MADDELRLVISAQDEATPVLQRYQSSLGQAQAATLALGNAAAATREQHLNAANGITAASTALDTHATKSTQATTATASLGGALSMLPGPLGTVASGFAGLHVQIEKSNVALLAVGAGMVAAGGLIGGALAGATHEAAQYQRALADVNVVTGASAEQMAQFNHLALELGASTQFNSKQVAQAFYEEASAGLTVSETLAATTHVIDAATLGHLNLKQATDTVTGVMRTFGLTSQDLGHIVDVETRAIQLSKFHWDDVAEAMRNAGPMAHLVGMSIEETSAALMAMANAGQPAALAGTALSTALQRLVKPPLEAAQAIQQLGLQVYNQQGQFVGTTEITRQLEVATAGMTDQQRQHAEAALGGARANRLWGAALEATVTIMQGGEEVTLKGSEALRYWEDQLKSSAGTAETASEKIRATLAFQIDNLKGSMGEAAIQLGNQFVPALQQLTPAVKDAVNAFVQAPPALQAGTAAFLAASAAGLTLAGIATTLGVVLPVAATALAAVGLAVAPVAAALATVAVASGALAAAWVGDWGNIRETTASVGAELGLFFQAFGNNIDKAIADIKTKGPAVRAALVDLFHPATTAEGQTNDPLLDLLLKGFNQIGEKGAEAAQAAGLKIKQNEIDALSPQDFANYYKSQLDATAQEEAGAWARTGETIAAAAFKAGTTIREEATKALNADHPEGYDSAAEAEAALQQYMDIALAEGRKMNLGYRAIGSTSGLALAEGLASAAPDVEAAANHLLESAKGDYKKAITEGLKEGVSTEVIQALLEGQRAAAGFQSVLKTLTDAQGAAALESEHLHGPLTALHELMAAGTISTEQYTEAIHGQVKAHGEGASAAQQHKAALDALLQSTDANQVKQGLWQQQTEQFVSSALPHLTAEVAAQAKAFENAGDDMGALNTVAQGFHITTNELLALIQNGTAATELWGKTHAAAAGEVTTHTGALTAQTAAHRELKGSLDATTLAADILEQRFASLVSSTLPHLSAELAGQVQAQENANGAQAAANLLYAQGAITQEQYAAATDGAAAATTRQTKAVDEHKAALAEMLKSTDAWTVSQGLSAQALDSFVNTELTKLPLGIRAVAEAQKNANDEMAAATTIGNYYGVGLDLIQMKLAGDISAQNQFTDAVKRTNDALANAAVGHTGLGRTDSIAGGGNTGVGWVGKSTPDLDLGALMGPYETWLRGVNPADYPNATPLNWRFEMPVRSQAQATGAALAQGIAEGADAGQSALNRSMTGLMAGAIQAAKDAAGIASPSRVMADEVGAQLGAGVSQGIDTATPHMVEAMTTALGAVNVAAASTAATVGQRMAENLANGLLGGSGGTLTPTIPFFSPGRGQNVPGFDNHGAVVSDADYWRALENYDHDPDANMRLPPMSESQYNREAQRRAQTGVMGPNMLPNLGSGGPMGGFLGGNADDQAERIQKYLESLHVNSVQDLVPRYQKDYGISAAAAEEQAAKDVAAGAQVSLEAVEAAMGKVQGQQQRLTTTVQAGTQALGQSAAASKTLGGAYEVMGGAANMAKSATDALAASEAASARARQQNAADLLAGTQTIGGFKVAAPTTTGSSGGTSNSSNLYSSSSTSGWASAYNYLTAGGLPHFATGGHVSRPTVAVVGDAGGETMVPDSQLGRLGGANIFVTLNYSPAVGIANNAEMQRAAQQLAATMKRELARLG